MTNQPDEVSAKRVHASTAARRREIVQSALELFLADGYYGTSLRAIARRIGMTHAGLLHHFDSKDELLVEVLHRWDLDTRSWFESQPPVRSLDDLVDRCVALIDRHRDEPALIRLLLTLSSSASDPRHPLSSHFRQRSRSARAFMRGFLAPLQERGQIPADVDLDQAAAWMVAGLDGLQLQWLNDALFPAADAMDAMLRRLLEP
ncbi:helix-turn-helix domain-containing protein [Nocardioides marinquilinus]|uniref:TetR/AcrR family transcriptional regulator n=1 Tax=Nocardioides marinquilinus TaxID=1210400 RepID=UPI0031E80D3A